MRGLRVTGACGMAARVLRVTGACGMAARVLRVTGACGKVQQGRALLWHAACGLVLSGLRVALACGMWRLTSCVWHAVFGTWEPRQSAFWGVWSVRMTLQ
jgi:hypothetical protein